MNLLTTCRMLQVHILHLSFYNDVGCWGGAGLVTGDKENNDDDDDQDDHDDADDDQF